MNRITRLTVLGGALLLSAAAPPAPSPAPAPGLSVRLHPGAPDAAGRVPYLDVAITADAVQAGAGNKLFELAAETNTVETSAKAITNLIVRDAAGDVPVTVADHPINGSNIDRYWMAGRPVSGQVTISYRVPIDATLPPFVAPQYELRTEDGTVSGATNAFLMLPADDRARRLRIGWDLSAMGRDARAASSLGVGDQQGGKALTHAELGAIYIMAGRPGLYASPTGDFFGVWQGKPPFDADALMQWAGKLHRFYGDFFRYMPPRFGVFARTNPRNPGSGIGLTDSFAFTFNQTSRAPELRSLLAHEMLHAWVNSLDGSMDQAEGLAASWFGEGLAVYYQRLLPWRAGMISTEDYLDDLNSTAGRYYTNALINAPNDRIPEGFWRDTRIRVLPYDRGSLYFARVNAEIEAASHGRRSLDDLVRTMLADRRAGKPMDLALWKRLLGDALGQKGLAEFEGMLAGKTVVVPSDAFGPCFRRTTVMLRRWQLGFDPASLVHKPRLVTGLIPGSNAARAGLRDGDEILNHFPQDGPQGDQKAMLTLEVKRDGRTFPITYLPRGEAVPAYQWERNPDAPGSCAAS
ncbi:MAG TPA: peptidase M61 [Sphingomonas sp.]|nr:peptidase M61 [Sphingomonas sp.]